MMKKLLGILFAVMLLTSAALAEGGVWSLYAQTDAEPYLLGSAVPAAGGRPPTDDRGDPWLRSLETRWPIWPAWPTSG